MNVPNSRHERFPQVRVGLGDTATFRGKARMRQGVQGISSGPWPPLTRSVRSWATS